MSKVRYVILVSLMVVLSACGTVLHGSAGRATEIVERGSLRDLAVARGFYIGAAVAFAPLSANEEYRDTLKREFNMVVPENAMKMGPIHPQPTTYSFGAADAIVKFAEANGMKVRGHNLVWHEQMPEWIKGGKFTRDELLNILHDHIKTVVEHYKGRILAWDVVNEAIGDSGALRNDVWLSVIGPDYIDNAFRWAHEADPKAKLFYNDYGGEGMNGKSNAIYTLVKGMKERGVPIDGVGLQMHISLNNPPSADAVQANIERIGALGLQVHITEMDVKIQDGAGTLDEKLAAQAQLYYDMASVCLKTDPCKAFLTWGFTDQYTWITSPPGRPDAPLLFDKTYAFKPAYGALGDALAER
ncbi:MAG: endo-1,4-beta-xylanase [Chloroflexota bacterium]